MELETARSWREYNEVTTYLKSRKKEMHFPQRVAYEEDDDYLDALEEQLQNHRSVFNRIHAFKGFIDAIESKEATTGEALNELQQTMDSMIQLIQRLRER